MAGNRKKETIFVAMSGGVDSSVAAGLLVREGYNVEGITLVFHPQADKDKNIWYCGDGAVENSASVCDLLGIKHHVVNCFNEFENIILRPAWETYRSGRTPSPCIICNARLKFSKIMEIAKSQGASAMATGHYAIIEHGDKPVLRRGEHARKDQTYFLYALNKEQLNFTRFPLGKLKKSQVRELAADMGFANAEQKESQDACFAAEGVNYQEALRKRFKGQKIPGNIVAPDGKILGTHEGIHNYTIGQRRGLKVAMGKRAFVSRIDPVKNIVVLTTEESDLFSSTLIASDLSWTGDVIPEFPLNCEGQIRYRSRPYKGKAEILENGKIKMVFAEPQRAVTPGQALVLYDGDRVLGGGWIE